MNSWSIIPGDVRDVLATLEAGSVQCCVTPPPYWGLRDYGHAGQIGLEPTPDAYVEQMVGVFREVRRVLADDGVLWLNLGDCYAGSWGAQGRQGKSGQMANRSVISARQIAAAKKKSSGTGSTIHLAGLKPKDLIGIPWRVAFALQADGWYLRSDCIWAKPNPMPESITDRPTKAHEYVFLLSKSERYVYDKAAICEPYHEATLKRGRSVRQVASDGAVTYRFNGEPLDEDSIERGRNARTVWMIPTQPFRGAHFAVMPEALVEPCILAGSRQGDTVLDPFAGSGTVGVVALRHGRSFVGVELNPTYVDLARQRIRGDAELLNALSEKTA